MTCPDHGPAESLDHPPAQPPAPATPPPTKTIVLKAIRRIKSGKATDANGLRIDVSKLAIESPHGADTMCNMIKQWHNCGHPVLSGPNDHTDGYVPLRNATEAKRLHLDSAGHSVQLQEEQVNSPRMPEVKVHAVLNTGGSATPPAGWTGDKWCSGERGLGCVCTAGDCCLEAFLVGCHNPLTKDRGAGVAVFRGPTPTGNGGFVDHDVHFDPKVDPCGGDHLGRPFLSAIEFMRQMMVAHVLKPGWWEQNKDTATACRGGQPPVAAAQIAWDDVTIDTVIESLSTDRLWFGDYEIGTLAAVTNAATAVHDCPSSSAPTQREREDEVFDTPTQRLGGVFGKSGDPLVQLV